MSNKKLKIMDWYCHQGHQYEFFKTGHDFYLADSTGRSPNWNRNHRPLNSNVHLVRERAARSMKFDAVMIRSPLNLKRYQPFIKNGATPIAVVQTTNVFNIPKEVKHIVWNSSDVMKRNLKRYADRKNYYIVHGYDPAEFRPLNLEKNGRILTVANVFKGRSEIMGFPLWRKLSRDFRNIDIVGHGNEDIPGALGNAPTFDDLIKIYNAYDIFFNPTKDSAMPRSRAEAAMCGMPIVTTNNFDIGNYFTHRKNAILTNDYEELSSGIIDLLNSKDMREEYGRAAREIAIKHFHIDDYIRKWNNLLSQI